MHVVRSKDGRLAQVGQNQGKIVLIKNKNVQMLTLPEAFRPEKLTIWVNFYVESEFQIENTRFLHPDLEN